MSATSDLPSGLVFVSDDMPGCTRRAFGRGFAYYDPEGVHIKDPEIVSRFNALAVPPAYREVWLCPNPKGHLQATGRDVRGRKQYRYHADFRAFRESQKFSTLPKFGRSLGSIRRSVNRILRQSEPGEKSYAIALAVKILDRAGFRIGNDAYLRENRSRGILTLEEDHVSADEAAARMEFEFRTKGGQRVSRKLTNRRLASCVNRLQELPGQRLFVYRNTRGGLSELSSEEVNAFLSERTDHSFTAKDFRTWIGTRETAATLARLDPAETSQRAAWQEASQNAASFLGNTLAVARKSYIHPDLNSRRAFAFFDRKASQNESDPLPGMSRLETLLVEFLESPTTDS